MNPLLRKELRLLLPAWVMALAAATLPLWIGGDYLEMELTVFALSVFFVGLAPFGQEMTFGTFSLLLAQPEQRRRLWNIKAALSAMALLSAWGVMILSCWDGNHQAEWRSFIGNSVTQAVVMSGLIPLVAFAGGLWTTLLFREMTTAFFASLIVPLVLMVSVALLLSHWDQGAFSPAEAGVIAVLCAYAVAGFFAARHLFLHAQDVTWTGGQISLASARGGPFRWLSSGFRKRRGPCLALIYKELQLQEITMILAPVLALLHLAALAVRHFAPTWAAHGLFNEAGFLWMFAPFVVGCVAVAEERRGNTLESLLCLPVRKRTQFAVKFAVVMALGTLLGGVCPWVLENLGGGNFDWMGFDALGGFMLGAAAIAAISFFASTMSRGMLQSFTVALLFPFLLGAAFGFYFQRFDFGSDVMGRSGWLFASLAWPAMLAAYFWMAFRNYKSLQPGWRLWAGNFIRFVVVFASVTLLASAIFDRSWEYLMPLEPHHGPARLNGAGRAMMAGSRGDRSFYALLPDGRLWVGQRDKTSKNLSGRFVGGSDWVDLAAMDYTTATNLGYAAALKSDGTLWSFSRKLPLRQIGSDSDWKKVVAGPSLFLALKQNGTLWGWGTDGFGNLPNHPGKYDEALVLTDPVQLWKDSDWVNVFAEGQSMAVKRDGSIWRWGYDGTYVRGGITNYASFYRLVRVNVKGTNWSSLAGDDEFMMGVRTDGSLWARGNHKYAMGKYAIDGGNAKIFGNSIPPGFLDEAVRIGLKRDWVGVSQGNRDFVALEADGTIWTLRHWNFQNEQPSRYHDWLAAQEDGFETWGLAKDGTITCWENIFRVIPYEESKTDWFILKPSRRPLASINIFNTP